MWFGKPKHTFESVAKRLVEGLENGTLVLREPTQGIEDQAVPGRIVMAKQSSSQRFLLCVNNDAFPASLEVRKVYQEVPDPAAAAKGFVRVIDESGEDYLYPADRFVVVDLPQTVVDALLAAS